MKNKIATKKAGNLKVEIFQEDIYSRNSSIDTTTGGVGVKLEAILKAKNNSFTLFEGQVRGTGRYGDDFAHWYSQISDIKKKDGNMYVTLESGTYKDTYEVSPESGTVKLYDRINLESERRQKEVEQIENKIKHNTLEEILDGVGQILEEKYEGYNCKKPEVYEGAIDKEANIGILVMATYDSGYDPMVDELTLFKVKPDGSYIKLKTLDLPEYTRPKYTQTMFRPQELKVSNGKVYLKGIIVQHDYERNRTNELDSIEKTYDLGGEKEND